MNFEVDTVVTIMILVRFNRDVTVELLSDLIEDVRSVVPSDVCALNDAADDIKVVEVGVVDGGAAADERFETDDAAAGNDVIVADLIVVGALGESIIGFSVLDLCVADVGAVEVGPFVYDATECISVDVKAGEDGSWETEIS